VRFFPGTPQLVQRVWGTPPEPQRSHTANHTSTQPQGVVHSGKKMDSILWPAGVPIIVIILLHLIGAPH
jgi:hypothetical protein